jgi:hypothetical protein
MYKSRHLRSVQYFQTYQYDNACLPSVEAGNWPFRTPNVLSRSLPALHQDPIAQDHFEVAGQNPKADDSTEVFVQSEPVER